MLPANSATPPRRGTSSLINWALMPTVMPQRPRVVTSTPSWPLWHHHDLTTTHRRNQSLVG
jgi:hypothetical protein